MKRSEAIKIAHAMMRGKINVELIDPLQTDFLINAHDLIRIAENIGMLPPDQRAYLPAPEECIYEWDKE